MTLPGAPRALPPQQGHTWISSCCALPASARHWSRARSVQGVLRVEVSSGGEEGADKRKLALVVLLSPPSPPSSNPAHGLREQTDHDIQRREPDKKKNRATEEARRFCVSLL